MKIKRGKISLKCEKCNQQKKSLLGLSLPLQKEISRPYSSNQKLVCLFHSAPYPKIIQIKFKNNAVLVFVLGYQAKLKILIRQTRFSN